MWLESWGTLYVSTTFYEGLHSLVWPRFIICRAQEIGCLSTLSLRQFDHQLLQQGPDSINRMIRVSGSSPGTGQLVEFYLIGYKDGDSSQLRELSGS